MRNETDTIPGATPDPADAGWMALARRLALRGWGRTTPNPLVGAVVVSGARAVGVGFHARAGEPHAEVHALRAAGPAARGATLYVTLEPCSTWGRTPPCTDAVVAAGVRRVVIGCLDPNPNHAGRAGALLEAAGIAVTVGVQRDACEALNDAFFHWIRHGRPLVLLKLGMTLDGRIATRRGQSQWITGPRARARVQRYRRWADAIMVGAETVRQDDPSLTVRTPQHWWRQPLPIVWSRHPDALPRDRRIVADPVRPPRFAHPLTPPEWREFLLELGRERITALLIEGGGELAGAALRADAVDRVAFFVAPLILGGRGSRAAIGGDDPATLAEALRLHDMRIRTLPPDVLITGSLHPCSPD